MQEWKNNPRLVSDIDNLMQIVERTRELRLYSYTAIGGALQPYVRELIAESVQTVGSRPKSDLDFETNRSFSDHDSGFRVEFWAQRLSSYGTHFRRQAGPRPKQAVGGA